MRLIIRISSNTLAFATIDTTNTQQPVTYQPYEVKNGISMAANLREAIGSKALPEVSSTQILIDAPVLLVPIDLFDEKQKETLYYHSFPNTQGAMGKGVLSYVIPSLNCVAVYAVNSDLMQVINDHYPQAQYIPAAAPVWRHLHQRSFTGVRAKLYVYMHDRHLDVFCFQQNRFKFHNTFQATSINDITFYILYVWKQLNMQQDHDELHILNGNEELIANLSKYLKRAYVINPVADFNRSPVTQIEGMPYDLMTLIVKGR